MRGAVLVLVEEREEAVDMGERHVAPEVGEIERLAAGGRIVRLRVEPDQLLEIARRLRCPRVLVDGAARTRGRECRR